MRIESMYAPTLRIVVVKNDNPELLALLRALRAKAPASRIGSAKLPCYISEVMPEDTIYVLAPESAV